MRNISSTIILILLGSGVLADISCNRYTAPDSGEAIEDRRTAGESRYNLMGFPGDREIVTAGVPACDDSIREESDSLIFPEYSLVDSSRKEIFAVQVFASKSMREAERFSDKIAPLFDEQTITDYKPPYYKVRIGNCANLDEAEALLEKVKSMGFRNAWLVRIRTQ